MMAFLFWLAAVGAVVDWRYMRRGGTRPTREDWHGLWIALGVFGVAIVGLLVMGASAGGLGDLAGIVGALIFFFWEVRRWRARRRAPVV